MSLTKFTGDTNNIQSLADQPNLTASQLKAKFDKTGDDLKTYINSTLTSEIDTEFGNKANSSNVYTKTQTNEKTDGTVLLNNKRLGGGTADRSATLSDSIENYKYIDIFSGNNRDLLCRTYKNNDSYIQPTLIRIDSYRGSGVSRVEFPTLDITISGTALTVDSIRGFKLMLQESTGAVTGELLSSVALNLTIIGYK